ncbi:glycosyltransferase family 4 protein [Pseudoalteromonas sp. APC 3691]|uniref:glycosyltransferase family 4 protein n=1 Tax=Pseudoalteromonas sp. APC 3691 TaxID=3035173 RepID=UPI0025B5D2CB|nr:glycosyltransferase family 4 protein [Pseudoalteromonas sp. APC 3691]MDN3389545.1 glycosyltransferase family 4 protein [Pseudoalteromonas sp. APC 3691]
MKRHKILLLSKYSRKGASSRLRTIQYISYLESKGINIKVKSFFNDEYLEKLYAENKVSLVTLLYYYLKRLYSIFTVFQYDAVWVEKELFLYFPALFERLLSKLGVRYIVDYDDAIFHNYDMSKSKFIRYFLSYKIDVVMRNAHTVIAGNDYLATRAKKAGAKNIIIIPTVVDIERYSQKSEINSDKLTIGWIGSPSTQKYVVNIKSALIELSKAFDITINLVGASESVVNELMELNVIIETWSEKTEVSSIKKMDIGIMPLEDGPWEKGKCGYKLIQYMACGVPVVASPVGVNINIVNNSMCGLLANTTIDWTNALKELIEDKKKRELFGFNGRKAVENTYSTNAQQEKLLNALSLVSKGK